VNIALGVPVFNEEIHIDMQIKNALKMDVDNIIFLDDGSTDNTLSMLKEYSDKYSNIHVVSDDKNSVLSAGKNRWKKLHFLCTEFNPDWIILRACDQIYSSPCFKNGKYPIKSTFEEFDRRGVTMGCLPEIHLWRSEWWYRVDDIWGGSSSSGVINHCWKNNGEWDYRDRYDLAIPHQGGHIPNYYGGKPWINKHRGVPKIAGVNVLAKNNKIPPFPVVILHYGCSSHEKIVSKFDWQVKQLKFAKGLTMPKNIPHPAKWCNVNGFRSAHEFGIKLKKVEDMWFEEDTPDVERPIIYSLAKDVEKYDGKRAREYSSLFKSTFGEEIFYAG
jgi:hypothetical protein